MRKSDTILVKIWLGRFATFDFRAVFIGFLSGLINHLLFKLQTKPERHSRNGSTGFTTKRRRLHNTKTSQNLLHSRLFQNTNHNHGRRRNSNPTRLRAPSPPMHRIYPLLRFSSRDPFARRIPIRNPSTRLSYKVSLVLDRSWRLPRSSGLGRC